MNYIRYDEQEMIRKLDQLDLRAKVAFAAACAERQIPGYILFSKQTGRGDPDALVYILKRVWKDVVDDKMTDDEVQRGLDRCMTLIPPENEEPWVNEQAYAEDAASAVAYALRARGTDDSQEAAYAARVAYEALDHYVSNHEQIDTSQPSGERLVLSHPLVQAELARQRRDLDELLSANAADPAELLGRLRDRASAEAAIFFGPVS